MSDRQPSKLFDDAFIRVMRETRPLAAARPTGHYKDEGALEIHEAAIEALGGDKLSVADAVAFYGYLRSRQTLCSDEIDETESNAIFNTLCGLEIWFTKQRVTEPEEAMILCSFLLDALEPDVDGEFDLGKDERAAAIHAIRFALGWMVLTANKAKRLLR